MGHAAVILCRKMAGENESLGKVLDEWEIEGLTWTNTSLLHRLVVTEDIETLRSRKSEITPEMVNLTCAVQEDKRHHLSQVTALYMACMLGPMDAGNVELTIQTLTMVGFPLLSNGLPLYWRFENTRLRL